MSGEKVTPPDADTGLRRVKPDPPLPSEERRRRLWLWLRDGYRAEPAPSRLGVLEAPVDDERLGICCSGGGIRSASFNLGALQALRREHELGRAKYLAAVSGGSYIAGAVCMVAKTWPEGPRPPRAKAGHDDSDPELVTTQALPFHPQSPEEQYLRNRSTYMAPTRLDKLFLVWRVLLGLLVNLTLVGLPLFALGTLLAIALYRREYGYGLAGVGPLDISQPASVMWTLYGVMLVAVVLGLLLLMTRPKSDALRRGLETWSLRMLLLAGTVALLFVAIPELIVLLRDWLEGARETTASARAEVTGPAVGAGATGIGSLLLAALLELRSREAHPSAVSQDVGRARNALNRASPRIRRAFVYVATLIAGPVLLVGIVVVAASLATMHAELPNSVLVWGLLVPGLAFGVLYFVSDLNTWSLHPFYRRRLCSAFALKRVKVDIPTNEGVPPVRAVERDYDRLVPLSKSGVWPGPSQAGWPTLLVCAAVNVSDPGATPPGRGVSSFTFSRDTIGGPLVGGIRTTEYEKRLGANRLRDITLPAAMAMSGAAISPSMGKATNVPLRMLMALANVRLGVWVPNPRHVKRWRQSNLRREEKRGTDRKSGIETFHPRRRERRPRDVWKHPRLSYLFRELVGRNRVDGRFLYVTDGGHYENLGLVELLRRGCMKIYCFDASGGKPAAALGDAIALARSELGVDVRIDPTQIKLNDKGFAQDSCVIGTIDYGVHDGKRRIGRLVYAPTVLTQHVPWDVRAYKEADPIFPHHSTGDQLYTDQRFEAYRALGEYAGERARRGMATGL